MNLFDLNNDINNIIIYHLRKIRFNYVIQELKNEFMIRKVFINYYLSGRKIHYARFFLNKNPSTIYNNPYKLI